MQKLQGSMVTGQNPLQTPGLSPLAADDAWERTTSASQPMTSVPKAVIIKIVSCRKFNGFGVLEHKLCEKTSICLQRIPTSLSVSSSANQVETDNVTPSLETPMFPQIILFLFAKQPKKQAAMSFSE